MSDRLPSRTLSRLATGARSLIQPIVAVLIALAIGAILITASGNSAIEGYTQLFRGAFGTVGNLADSLTLATTLLFTSLAFTIAFRAGVFNAGAQGQFLMGAFAAAWVGFTFQDLPGPLIVLLALLAGAVAGSVWALVPAVLRERWGVNEIVTTLMLAYVAALLGQYLIVTWFSATGGQVVSTPSIAESAELLPLLPPSRLSWTFFLGIALVVGYRLFLSRTTRGYELEFVGKNLRAAQYAGIGASGLMLSAMIVGGAVAGVGGAQEILAVQHRYLSTFSVDVGLTGIIASLLAQNRPLALIPACILLGGLQNGALNMEIMTDVHRSVVGVVSALIVMLAAAVAMPGRARETWGSMVRMVRRSPEARNG